MIELGPRDMFLLKKALAIAIVAIERQPGPLQPTNDMQDMKLLLDEMTSSNNDLALLMKTAQIAVTGQTD